MPHVVLKKDKLISTPSQNGGVTFNFVAKSFNNTDKFRKTEYKIGVTNQNKDFLLTIKDKDENYLLKFDKPTRVTPVEIVKEALNAYADESKSEVLFSNTRVYENRVEPEKEYLKEINYFVDEFETDKEVQIEIGFGSGRHLLYQAQQNPDVQFIGLEIHTPSIEQLLKQVKILGIKNILVVNYDARLFMEFIKSNSVGKIFVHFPVPWDKKPHRRVYSNEFIAEAKRVLKIDGSLELRTDSRKYFDYCVELLTNLNSGRLVIDINKDLPISSKYEDRWKRMEKNIYDVVLYANSEDEEKIIEKDFSFKNSIIVENTIKNFPLKPIVTDNFFLHFEDIYIIEGEENSALFAVTLGSFNKPLNKYIIVKNGEASYFQGKPIPTSSNIEAHKKIEEIFSK